MTNRVNRQWRLASRPAGRVQDSNFQWVEEKVPPLQDGQVLVRNLFLSLDPTNRGWMNEQPTYLPPVAIGEVMRGGTIGVVEESRNQNIKEGTHVSGLLGWQDYAISNGTNLTPLPDNRAIPLTAYMAVFGHIGLTAYYGLLDIGQPKPGETLVVSGAAGAVGSLVGQIGKIKGCRVVGIAGSDDKCRWLTADLGFDVAINYKTEDVLDRLKLACPGGIDVYFDNVGGAILDAVLSLINLRARISLCGLISQYNATEPVPGPYNFVNILLKRARIEGFVVLDYMNRAEEAFKELGRWLAEGKIKYRIDLVEGLQRAPEALNMLFDGANTGKLAVKL